MYKAKTQIIFIAIAKLNKKFFKLLFVFLAVEYTKLFLK